MYGINNPVDGAVLEVILRKAERIRKELGVPVPCPDEGHTLTQALLKAVLLRRKGCPTSHTESKQLEALRGGLERRRGEGQGQPHDLRAARLKPEDVLPEWHKSLAAIGGRDDVKRFTDRALARLGSGLEPLAQRASRRPPPRSLKRCASASKPRASPAPCASTSATLPPLRAAPCSAATPSSPCSPRRCSSAARPRRADDRPRLASWDAWAAGCRTP
jgi:hypothetical protein